MYRLADDDLDADAVHRIVDEVLGNSTFEGGEHTYDCFLCERQGRAHVGHIHINFRKGKAICHSCMGGFKSLRSLVLSLCGKIPKDLVFTPEGENLEETLLNMMYGKKARDVGEDKGITPLPDGFVKLTRHPKDPLGRVVLQYLTGTDLNGTFGRERAIPFEKLRMVGAGYGTSGPTRGYAIFPVTVNGEYVMYTSRRVSGLRSKTLHGGKSANALFNYDNCRESRRIFIGEGPFDAICLHGNLRPTDGGVATLGTVLHPEQAELLNALPCAEELVVYYDADAHEKAVEAAKVLRARTTKRVSIVYCDGADPDELSRADLVAAVKGRKPYSESLSALEQVLKW